MSAPTVVTALSMVTISQDQRVLRTEPPRADSEGECEGHLGVFVIAIIYLFRFVRT